MLLKITEKIIPRNVFEERKESRVKLASHRGFFRGAKTSAWEARVTH